MRALPSGILVDVSNTIRIYADLPSAQDLYARLPLRDIISSTLSVSILESQTPEYEDRLLLDLLEKRFQHSRGIVDLDAYQLFCEGIVGELDTEITRKYPVYSECEDFVFTRWIDKHTVRLDRQGSGNDAKDKRRDW